MDKLNFLETLNIANRELRKVLGNEVKVLGRSECCISCTTYNIGSQGYKYYIAWKIFNSGMNCNIQYYKDRYSNVDSYACWNLTDEQLDKTIEVLSKYFKVERPADDTRTINIYFE